MGWNDRVCAMYGVVRWNGIYIYIYIYVMCLEGDDGGVRLAGSRLTSENE